MLSEENELLSSTGRRINFNEVKEIVQRELCGSGSNLGYRRVWSHLSTSGI